MVVDGDVATMASQRLAGQRFRQRKLSVKHPLAILREHEVELTFDDEAQRNMPKFETGVEKAEEIEHHLQAIIGSHTDGDKPAYIPTPPTNVSSVQYGKLYSPKYKHPHSYIRFSSTVEDCIGCPYSMNHEDRVFLAQLNESSKRSPSKRPWACSEDQFELVMEFFEETSSLKQPYATVDNSPVLPFSEMEASFDETIDDTARLFAKDIYEHWKERRLATENHPLIPALKFERNVDTDDADPYVCFRRREVRQARKTRGRDAQIVEKLKRLRIELEHARQLMHLTKQREQARRDQLLLDRQIFEQRVSVKETKRNLNIPGDDLDLLINQKPVEKAPKPEPRAPIPGTLPRVPMPRAPESELHLLADDRLKREHEVNAIIQESMGKHRAWNSGMVDHTWRPITPPLEVGFKPSFRAAVTEYLPSPPNSASGDDAAQQHEQLQQLQQERSAPQREKPADDRSPFRYVSPPPDTGDPRMSFRRRVGRGGRMWVDRRGPSRNSALYKSSLGGGPGAGPNALADAAALREQLERLEYDVDSDDESDEVHINDPYDNLNIRYRIIFTVPPVPRGDQHAAAAQQRMVEDALKRNVAGRAIAPQKQVAAK